MYASRKSRYQGWSNRNRQSDGTDTEYGNLDEGGKANKIRGQAVELRGLSSQMLERAGEQPKRLPSREKWPLYQALPQKLKPNGVG